MSNELQELAQLARSYGCRVSCDEPLCKHTSFKIGGNCSCMIEPCSTDALTGILRFVHEKNVRMLVMGNGSNMLCSDDGFSGAVLLFDSAMGKLEQIDDTTLRAEAGCSLINVCKMARDLSLTGLEFAYGIPGTVGGGVFMNAGAYGGEMKDVVKRVTAMDRLGNPRTYPKRSLELTYRSSRFLNSGEIIVSADFELKRGNKDEIDAKMKEIIEKRKMRQPLEFPNAGSTFKRPEGQYAGRLIQECGLSGFTVGGAQVSEKHCGFVINKGGATCSEVRAVIDHIQRTVREATGFNLECEVRIIPYE